jgi:autotransporter-associated beta strand protein
MATLVAALAASLTVAEAAHAQLSAAPPPIKSYTGDPGKLGDPASWRTPEFLRDNGMLSIGAEFAYAAGYAGQGEVIGIVDSGTFKDHVREHGSFDNNYTVADRFIGVVAQGGNTGPIDGFVNPAFNDTHGTHTSGTVAASRDGQGEPTRPTTENMHGVAFDIDLYMGNTGKTDGVLYGKLPANPTVAQTPDNGYIGNAYRAVNAATTRNGKPIRIITTSWGSQPATENYSTLETPAGRPASEGLNAAMRYLAAPEGVADADGNTTHWLNGAFDVARTGTIVQFTAGNGSYWNPTPRAAAPYYFPDLEHSYYTTAGVDPGVGRTLNPDGSVLVPGTQRRFNNCGVAKWTCVTAPSDNINSTYWANNPLRPTYASASGTSMAGPHSAAALALIMQRFPYMTNEQAMHTMFTTGRQNASLGLYARSGTGDLGTPNPDAGKIVQVPDIRNGWNTVSLRDAMHGPGQLLGPNNIDTKGYSDVWSNNISDVAIQARQAEDAAEATAWQATKEAKGWTNGVPDTASDQDKFDYATGVRRETARNARVYVGSLIKSGEGTLFLTGTDGWHGATTVSGGKLSVNGSLASPVTVANGGTLGGLGTVSDAVTVNAGTLAPGLSAAEASKITDVTLQAGNVLKVGSLRMTGGTLAIAARSATDYTSIESTGDVVLGGQLALDLQGALAPGTSLVIAKGRTVTGTFAGLPEGTLLQAGGKTLRITYANNAATLVVAATSDGTVGGNVPATLALTLGAPASFGPFTPGVGKDYTASTIATVLSTAGDATLSVADPATTNTGKLVNGAFALPQVLQAGTGSAFAPVGGSSSPTTLKTWSAPTSNEAMTINFKQTIGANDALRTGTYAKTLTFTLSTTTP